MTDRERKQIAQFLVANAEIHERLADAIDTSAEGLKETAGASRDAAIQSRAQARFVEEWGTEPSGNGSSD